MNKKDFNLIRSLGKKKTRSERKLFVVEGIKSILELIGSDFEIQKLLLTRETLAEHRDAFEPVRKLISAVDEGELAKASSLEFNNTGIAIVKQKKESPLEIKDTDLVVMLDDIRDPGNLGTIIRTADWYGVSKIICSTSTADFYNSKAVAASMGSFTRMDVYYTDLPKVLKEVTTPVIAAMLDGMDAHTFEYPESGILLIGNEANGISAPVLPFVTHAISIPSYGNAESLNAALATGILLDNWKRNLA